MITWLGGRAPRARKYAAPSRRHLVSTPQLDTLPLELLEVAAAPLPSGRAASGRHTRHGIPTCPAYRAHPYFTSFGVRKSDRAGRLNCPALCTQEERRGLSDRRDTHWP